MLNVYWYLLKRNKPINNVFTLFNSIRVDTFSRNSQLIVFDSLKLSDFWFGRSTKLSTLWDFKNKTKRTTGFCFSTFLSKLLFCKVHTAFKILSKINLYKVKILAINITKQYMVLLCRDIMQLSVHATTVSFYWVVQRVIFINNSKTKHKI